MNISSIIQYEGDNQTVIWKHTTVNFNSSTQLIVHESQEAIFFLNGEALDSFGPGRHTLETGKLPLLSQKLFGRIVDNGEVFHSEVYFVNLVDHMSIPWGTNPKIKYIDQSEEGERYRFEIGLFGELSLKIKEPRKVVVNLVGTEEAWGQEMLMSRFRPMLMQKLRSNIAKSLSAQSVSIFELDLHTEEIAEEVKAAFNQEISAYGLEISGLWVNGFLYPENDPMYQSLKNLRFERVTSLKKQKIEQEIKKKDLSFAKEYETSRVQLDVDKEIITAQGSNKMKIMGAEADKETTILGAQADAERTRETAKADADRLRETAKAEADSTREAAKAEAERIREVSEADQIRRQRENITSVQEHAFQVAEKIADNENVGNMSNTAVGLGMMGGMATGVGTMMAGITTDALGPISGAFEQPQQNANQNPNMALGMLSVVDGGQVGVNNSNDGFKQKVEQLKIMKDAGLMSEEEFLEQRQRLLDMIFGGGGIS